MKLIIDMGSEKTKKAKVIVINGSEVDSFRVSKKQIDNLISGRRLHPNTVITLKEHGFLDENGNLTELGKLLVNTILMPDARVIEENRVKLVKDTEATGEPVGENYIMITARRLRG